MIDALDPGDPGTALDVLRVQHAAYRVEADLIGFDGIPPLHESLAELIAQPLQWKGIRDDDGRVIAAMAITGSERRCDVDRLIVDPAFHRRGLGRRLMQSVMPHQSVTVSTGEANAPAVALYLSLGFSRVGRRQIAPDVWTVQFEHRSDHLRTSFDADVDAYQAARPDYPDALFGLLTQHGLQPGSRVLEIGPGTGQATMTLLARVAHVVAVEAGPQMAARLRQRVAGRACEVIESPFEHATVDGPFDLAVAATSFHWVDPIAGIVKLSELVPRGAWLALWWNVFRDVGPHDEAFAELLRPITQRFQTAERMSSVTSALDEPARRAEIQADGHFQLERVETFELPVTHDAASLRALFATFSDRSTLPEPDRTRALDDVGAIVDDHFGGSMTRVYLTRVYVARRR